MSNFLNVSWSALSDPARALAEFLQKKISRLAKKNPEPKKQFLDFLPKKFQFWERGSCSLECRGVRDETPWSASSYSGGASSQPNHCCRGAQRTATLRREPGR
jgi:hypothetical protein